jgi:branched-chain amino acid transport system permease protein
VLFQQIVNGISVGSMYALLAVGFSLVYNILGIANFSHGAMIALGAFFSYWIARYLAVPVPVAILASIAFTGLSSALVELVTLRILRKRGQGSLYFFIASLTVFNLVTAVLVYISRGNIVSYPRAFLSGTFTIGNLYIPWIDAGMLLISIVCLAVLSYVMFKTRFGLAVRAASFSIKAAQLMGMDIDAIIQGVFFVSGTLAGVTGALLGVKYAVYPYIGNFVYMALFACVVGGLGNLTGAVLGGLLIGLLETLVSAYISSAISPALTFAFLVVILLLRPQGLAGRATEEKI